MRRLSTPRRLRLLLGTLFLALAVPSALLVWRTERQIRLEAWHQQRESAEALTGAIDAALTRLVEREEARGYGDYRFLTVAGDPAHGVLSQRSPLAQLPGESDIPGLLGHFQVDPEGGFSTPLLLEDVAAPADLGMSAEERQSRLKMRGDLIDVLGKNRLLAREAVEEAPTVDDTLPEMAEVDADAARYASQAAFDRLNVVPMPAPSIAKPSPALEESDEASKQSQQRSARRERSAVVQQSIWLPNTAPTSSPAQVEGPGAGMEPPSDQSAEGKREPERDQAARDAMFSPAGRAGGDAAPSEPGPESASSAPSTSEARESPPPARQQPGASDLADQETSGLDAITVTGSRVRRSDVEMSAPASAVELPVSPSLIVPPAPRIDIFESVIDPFEFSRLDSGHFVLFRRVWNEGGRSIQGLLLDADRFIESELLAPFRASPLAAATTLAIGWRGVEISSATSAGPLDEPLHRRRLSAPFGDLELNLTLNRLDPGPGAQLTRWTGMVLLAVLLLGFVLLYRLGLGQLRLARQQQDFVAAVSHELKTPLTSIRMYGELLREGWVPDDKRREYYAYIHDESERLSRLIGNVLQLARMERQELALDIKPMAVGELFDLARSRLAAQIERAGFESSFELDPAVATRQVSVDSDALLQILINLVDNALKFSARADARRVDIAVREAERGSIEFSVRDHGPGVPRAQMRRIFELFYRAGDALTRETVGTGIGLALVHQLAHAMAGSIDVVNRDPGAEFRLRIPAG